MADRKATAPALINYKTLESFSFPAAIRSRRLSLHHDRLDHNHPTRKLRSEGRDLDICRDPRFLIGMSRVYIGVHYPTDVIAGFLGGAIWTTAVMSVGRPAVVRIEKPAARRLCVFDYIRAGPHLTPFYKEDNNIMDKIVVEKEVLVPERRESAASSFFWAIAMVIIVGIIVGALYYSGALRRLTTPQQQQKINVEVSNPPPAQAPAPPANK
jgi:hypothetical protein